MKKKAILCDVDGTLANIVHRLHHIKQKPAHWGKFKQEAYSDEPYNDIVWLVRALAATGANILIVTARMEEEREVTTKWLDEVAGLKHVYEKIYMRKQDDFREDSIIKKELLEQIKSEGYEPYMVIDDRNRVVKMWRDFGLRCLQVREGDF